MKGPIGAAEMILGLTLLGLTFYDLFQSVVLPRPSVRKVQLARTVVRPLWRIWKWVLNRGTRIELTERRLAAFGPIALLDRKSTRLNSSHVEISYAVFCLKKKNHLRDRLADTHVGHR